MVILKYHANYRITLITLGRLLSYRKYALTDVTIGSLVYGKLDSVIIARRLHQDNVSTGGNATAGAFLEFSSGRQYLFARV